MQVRAGRIAVSVCLLWALPHAVSAATLFIGSNGTDPLAEYTDTGTLLGAFGAGNAQAAALNGAGIVYLAYNNASTSEINRADSGGHALSTAPFTGMGGNFANFIADLAFSGNRLWVSGYNGMVYQLAPSGSILSSFNTGATNPGIATDGTYLYTTMGYGSGVVQKWNPDGTLVGTIVTGLTDALGIGYDASSSRLWVGGTDVVSRIDLNGTIETQLPIPGAHTGLEVGDIGSEPPPSFVPEPGSAALLLLGGCAIALFRARSRQ